MTYDEFRCRARAGNITIMAVGRTQPKDHLSPDSNCLVRRGRDTTQFWSHFVDQPKYFDGAPEPLECGAVQIISNWVKARRATVLYPFSGSQYPPVYTWAPRDGSCHCFAAEMLVHDQADLLGALIGALTVSEQHEQPTSPTVLIWTAAKQDHACRPVHSPRVTQPVIMGTFFRAMIAQETTPAV